MIVGLFGIQGVYNFGCEAIVRGAYRFVQEIYPNCKVVYFSFSEAYDSKILNDLDIEIIPVVRKNTIAKRVVNKLYKTLNIEKRCSVFDMNTLIEKADIVISIGGDIYTIPQVLREQSKYPYYNPLVDFCDRAICKGRPVIVYGASVGPWGSYKKALDYNINALSKYKAILCREEKTIGYLKELGLNNVMFFPDPAFQIRELKEVPNKRYIGINLSPLSLKELYGNYDEVHIKKLASLLDDVYENTKLELMFIPHVLSQCASDNDLWYMEKIKNKMKYKGKVVFADSSSGFIGLKKYIAQCYVVVAARMHCAVNAIDENVPAIFLSYSQKSIGMCKYIYEDDKYLISLKNIDIELLEKIKRVLSQHQLLSEQIAIRNDEIKAYYERNIRNVQKLLKVDSK